MIYQTNFDKNPYMYDQETKKMDFYVFYFFFFFFFCKEMKIKPKEMKIKPNNPLTQTPLPLFPPPPPILTQHYIFFLLSPFFFHSPSLYSSSFFIPSLLFSLLFSLVLTTQINSPQCFFPTKFTFTLAMMITTMII